MQGLLFLQGKAGKEEKDQSIPIPSATISFHHFVEKMREQAENIGAQKRLRIIWEHLFRPCYFLL